MIEKEIGYNCQKILTGGYAPLIKTFLGDFQYDRNLILDGLYKLYEKFGGESLTMFEAKLPKYCYEYCESS